MEGNIDPHNNDTLEAGAYCYCDDNGEEFCYIEWASKRGESFLIIDFQDNRKRTVLPSSLERINDGEDLKIAKELHAKYLSSRPSELVDDKDNDEKSSISMNCICAYLFKSNNQSDNNKYWWWLIGFCCFIIMIALTVIVVGISVHDYGSVFHNGYSDQCEIIENYLVSCTYSCNCIGYGENEECDTCYGQRYQYRATTTENCGGTVFTLDDNLNRYCSDTNYYSPYSVSKLYDCWISDCDQALFSLQDPEEKTQNAINMYISGSIMFIIGCIGCVAACCKSKKYKMFYAGTVDY